MPWAYVQLATQGTWETYEKVSKELDPTPSEGLLFHAAGANAEGKWRVVLIWDSEEAFTRFRDEELAPTLLRVLGEAHMAQGPPPIEAFDVREMYAK
jgi:heme-degrading monooxygenase HmoA